MIDNLSRREFIAALMAGVVVTAEGLWMPGEKLISIPSRKFFIPEGTLAWLEDGVPMVRLSGKYLHMLDSADDVITTMAIDGKFKILKIPQYFDVDIRGFEVVRKIEV